jgi:hypothetical protein
MQSPKPTLPQTNPSDQPAFGCIVYVRKTETGRVVGRVANLNGLELEAASERDVLAGLVQSAKGILAAHLENGEDIPWVDPPPEKQPDEQKRFLPLHL